MQKLNLTTQGHDLQSGDLLAFFKKAEAAAAAGHRELALNAHEREFKTKVLEPILAKHSKFVVLAFSFQSFDSYQGTVGHEVMHSQYFMEPLYRDTVGHFWETQLTENTRAEVRKTLAAESYDPADEDLMRNEFQAFVLEPGAEDDRLGKFAVVHKKPLLDALTAAGVPPVQVR